MNGDAGGLDRVASNELLYVRLAKRAQAARGTVELVTDFACECTNMGCWYRLAMTAAEYEPIHASGALFVVAPGDEHVDAKTEQVVTKQQTHWVIEREPSVEMLAFYSSSRQTVGSELSLDPSRDDDPARRVVHKLTLLSGQNERPQAHP